MRIGIGESKEEEGMRDAETRLGHRTWKQSGLPADRELARSSPAFMVINWIVRTEK
jgi:hypothetical protein